MTAERRARLRERRYGITTDEANELLDALEAALLDVERLSWLGYTGHGFVRGTDISKWTIAAPEEGMRSLRQAIDAARAAIKKEQEG